MWQRSIASAGHVSVLYGHRGSLRLRGASVPFWLVVVWCRRVSLCSVCGWMSGGREVGTCGSGYTLKFVGLVYTHKHRPHRFRHPVLFIAVFSFLHFTWTPIDLFYSPYLNLIVCTQTPLYCVSDSAALVVFKGHMWSPGSLGCWGGHCLLSFDRWHQAQKLPLWPHRMEPALP